MKTSKQVLVRAAARNNAQWCAAMSRSHSLASEFGEQAWAAPSRTPLYYSAAQSLSVEPTEVGSTTTLRGHGWLAITRPGVGHGAFTGVVRI
ncbi:hypothetical protein OG345_17805 [Streptomyces sp. NBC_01220]|uniref:hypothetical protein n=1 Tax=unclassified Streptomyces TaxID=2593676 RepID=UPI00341608B8|nr:hypothetical protein OG345_17805 [Streptomyces sp. NBC_01220]